MLASYKLSDGSIVTGTEDEVELMLHGDMDWKKIGFIQSAVDAGRKVINLAHVIEIHPPNDVELTHYNLMKGEAQP